MRAGGERGRRGAAKSLFQSDDGMDSFSDIQRQNHHDDFEATNGEIQRRRVDRQTWHFHLQDLQNLFGPT